VRYIYFFLLVFFSPLFPENDQVTYHGAGIESLLPNATINGTVDAVTGTYLDTENDLVLPGPDSLTIDRHYHYSRREYLGAYIFEEFGVGNSINHPYAVGGYRQRGVLERNGTFCLFKKNDKAIKKIEGEEYTGYFVNDYFSRGLTNISSSDIGGQNNLKNYELYSRRFGGKQEKYQVLLPNGGIRYYYTPKVRDLGQKFYLQKEKLPSGNYYIYDYDNDWNLKKISLKNSNETLEFSSVSLIYTENSRKVRRIKASNGRVVDYQYSYDKSLDIGYNNQYASYQNYRPWPFIEKVSYHDKPPSFFSYNGDKLTLTKKQASGNFLETQFLNVGKQSVLDGHIEKILVEEYYLDPRYKKVNHQYAPSGPNGERVLIGSFQYLGTNKDYRFTKSNITHHFDAYGNKTVYESTPEGRITSISSFQKEKKGQKLLKKERYYWGKKDLSHEGDLIARATFDASERVISGYFLTYDKNHNLKSKHFYGNLSGNFNEEIKLDEQGVPKLWKTKSKASLEVYSTYYEYSEKNQLIKKVEGGLTYLFQYHPRNRKLKRVLVKNKQRIIQREFYLYDVNTSLIKKIEDDGAGEEGNDFNGVSFRKTQEFILTDKAPYGLPIEIKESYWNPQAKRNFLKKLKKITYSKYGKVLKEEVYDPNGQLCSRIKRKHNSYGQVIKEWDECAQLIEREYNEAGQLIAESSNEGLSRKLYQYDKVGRCSKVIDCSLSSNRQPLKEVSSQFFYDKLGRVIKEKDQNSFVKSYKYDALGNQIKESLSSVLVNGERRSLTCYRRYDSSGNLTLERDLEGNKTIYRYNAYNKKTYALYTDGRKETWEYHLNGTLKSHTSVESLKTLYTYDVQQRVTKVEVLNSKGERAKISLNEYDALRLVRSIQADGKATKYLYDYLGRKIKEIDGSKKVKEFFYDCLDQVTTSKEYLNREATDYLLEEFFYDEKGRVTSFVKRNSEGHTQRKINKSYNANSNVISQTLFQNNEKAAKYIFRYDGRGQLEEEVDPLNHVTKFIYRTSFLTFQGEVGFMKKSIDPMGNYTVEQYNPLNQLVKQQTFSIDNKLLKSTVFTYNLRGLMLKQEDEVLGKKEVSKPYKILLSYDKGGRVLSVKEGVENLRTTSMSYDSLGRLRTKTLPSNKVIFMEYDALSRLKKRKAGEISFEYTYDQLDRVIKVKEQRGGEEFFSTCQLDEYGRIISEGLSNGLSLHYSFDASNRPVSLSLPVGGTINYVYNGYNLSSISREFDTERESYSIQFDKYTWQGKVLRTRFSAIEEEKENSLDLLGRRTRLESSVYQEEVPEKGFDPCGNLKMIFQGEEEKIFAYDSLLRLVKEDKDDASKTYAYDSLGNRTEKNAATLKTDGYNQLTDDASFHYKYDIDGNLIEKSNEEEKLLFKYDSFGRLQSIEQPKVMKKLLFYDYQDRLVSLVEKGYVDEDESYSKINSDKKLLYFGDFEIGAVENAKLTELRIITPKDLGEIGATQALEINEKVYFVFNDYQGSIKSLISLEDKKTFSWDYSAYGEIEQQPESFYLPWKYLGKREFLPDYFFFGKRLYDSQTGRFITKDPKGITEGCNPYSFADNRPYFYTDIQGFSKTQVAKDRLTIGYLISPICSTVIHMMNDHGVIQRIEEKMGFPDDDGIRVYPKGEAGLGGPPNIIFVNGIMNQGEDIDVSVTHIQSFQIGSRVSSVRNYSFDNKALDLLKCALEKAGVETRPVRDLKNLCSSFFDQSGENERIQVIAHSGGNIVSKSAFEGLSKDVRNCIDFVGIAPGSYVSSSLIPSSKIFVGNDIVPLFGGVFGDSSNINYLNKDGLKMADFHTWCYGNSSTSPLFSRLVEQGFEHSFKSESYRGVLSESLNSFSARNQSYDYLSVNIKQVSGGF
jgi:RHS repeat-associated protein